jgi:hypothetical protein
MAQSSEFAEFIRRIRAGDDQAARELVKRYEPVIGSPPPTQPWG